MHPIFKKMKFKLINAMSQLHFIFHSKIFSLTPFLFSLIVSQEKSINQSSWVIFFLSFETSWIEMKVWQYLVFMQFKHCYILWYTWFCFIFEYFLKVIAHFVWLFIPHSPFFVCFSCTIPQILLLFILPL